MRSQRLATLLSFIVLAGCAGASAAVVDPPHQAETPVTGHRPVVPLGLNGWSVWRPADGDPSRVYLVHQKPVMMLRVAIVRTAASPEEYVRGEAASTAKLGRPTAPIDATGATFASTKWTGTVGGHATNGVIAARRSAAAPNDLIVFSGYWPAAAGSGLEEEIDLLILLTSAE